VSGDRVKAILRASTIGLVLVAAAGAAAAQIIDTSAVGKPRHLKPHLPPQWQHGAFMEIFVRAYQDSDGDGGGDLRGLISRLDYLKELGIKGLWLMPVSPSADGDHGYATTDFRAIEPAYGTLADFDELLKQAHRRGIGIIVDYVINHAAASHPMFTEALKGPANPFHAWFVWSEDAPPGWDIWGKYPWYHTASEPWTFKGDLKTLQAPAGAKGFYFGTFGPHMPDFNFRHPPVLDYHLNSLRFWLNRGLDGFRLDAVPHLVENNAKDWNDQPESRRITKQVQDLILSYPRRYVVCEATAKPVDYGDPALCGGAFAFGYVQHFVGAALGRPESVQKLAGYYRSERATMATFVSNHDIFAGKRLWDQVDGDEAAYKLAAAGYLLQPGTPFIYYGEEVGQAGVGTLQGDLPLRAPMSWTADAATAGFTTGTPFRPLAPNAATHHAAGQQRDPQSIRAFYRAMLALRNQRPSIARGSFEHAFADGLVLGFQRRLGRERTLVLINYGRSEATVAVPGLAPRQRLRALHGAARIGATATLPPRSVQVVAIGR
jgi:alpha-amylase